jgi:mono/diheme cytochrome c family protein
MKEAVSKRGWKLLVTVLLVGFVGFGTQAFRTTDEAGKKAFDSETPLSKVLAVLGEEPRLHTLDRLDSALVRKGEELVKQGYTTKPNGKQTDRISKFYECTDCHNVEQENPDMSNLDPEKRLSYAVEQNLPFNQATTLFGVVNRESWYNGDYVKKYGDKVVRARDTLTNAIQLCATECAQGRALTDWEMKAMLNYLWSIQIKLENLDLSEGMMTKLNRKRKQDEPAKATIQQLKDEYYTASPATFVDAQAVPERAMGKGGDPEVGKAIYKHSCRTCHRAGGPTHYRLDYSVLTFNQLQRHFDDYKKKSIYQVLRYGTHPKKGYRPYMPHYTKERMSRQQVNDLAAYIRQEASASLQSKK